MADVQAAGGQDPTAQLLGLAAGFGICQALIVAARLGVADLLGDATKSAVAIAPAVGAEPQPLYRLTHHYFNARDTAWDRLEVAVAKAPADRLIVYVDWPGVSAQALRLIRPDGIFAVQRESGELQLNDNGTWLPVGQGNLARYTSSLVLSNDNGTGRLSLAGPPLKQPPGR